MSDSTIILISFVCWSARSALFSYILSSRHHTFVLDCARVYACTVLHDNYCVYASMQLADELMHAWLQYTFICF
jgi:hypothetical protein